MSFTPTVPVRSPLTDAILDHMDEHCLVPTGDARIPVGAGWQGGPGVSEFVPYLVLWPRNGGLFDGSLGDPKHDADFVYQLTAVGRTRADCEEAADLGRIALCEIRLDEPTFLCVDIDIPGGATTDQSVNPTVFISVEVYRISFTGAAALAS